MRRFQSVYPRSKPVTLSPVPLPGSLRPLLLLGLVLGGVCVPLTADEHRAIAHVVVIVDTSTSMREPGMDPQRASLLVTKLLADIVPGELAVIRLLDLYQDRALLPRRETEITEPCAEDPTKQCRIVEPASDWEADARSKRLGALIRPGRGDPGFKEQIEQHLEQRINNSFFHLAFRAAQGVLDDHRPAAEDVPQTVIWLSDGRSDEPHAVEQVIRELTADGVAVEAMVFGRGDPTQPRQAGLDVYRVSSPAEMMRAFAGAFRRIVQAPYEIDNEVSAEPRFEIKPRVDEAWVVVYGDDTLSGAGLTGPRGAVPVDYAADAWRGAGAYRVAHLERPAPGSWTVSATGGGPGVAYAVVQRSALTPALLEPRQAFAGVAVPLVAAVLAGPGGEVMADPQVLGELKLNAEFQGESVVLRDDGSGGDAVAGDGRYTATVTFHGAQPVPVRIRLRGPIVERKADAVVGVSGRFRYAGGPVAVDFGTLTAGSEACRRLTFTAEHLGAVLFELRGLRRPPSGHRFEVRLAAGTLTVRGATVAAGPEDTLQLCLVTGKRSPSSAAVGEPWLELAIAGSREAEQTVPLHLSWKVEGLSFWQRWGWLVLLILGALLLLLIILGLVLPHRFAGSFAVAYVPERDELDEQTPQPVKQWRGVRSGFYRDARAFLHPDFRISGRVQGALAALHAQAKGVQVAPGRGMSLFRETLDGDWEAVPPPGRRGRPGDVYRIGEGGPYFRIASRGC